MSKKVLDIEAIKNELEGASLFFTKPATNPPPALDLPITKNPFVLQEGKPKPEKPKVDVTDNKPVDEKYENDKTNERSLQRTNERPLEPTNEQNNVLPRNRMKIRHTFDIYSDQLLSLREIAIDQEKMFGERVLLGDLAQQALDMLITKEKNK
jgi:hypothetical protein